MPVFAHSVPTIISLPVLRMPLSFQNIPAAMCPVAFLFHLKSLMDMSFRYHGHHYRRRTRHSGDWRVDQFYFPDADSGAGDLHANERQHSGAFPKDRTHRRRCAAIRSAGAWASARRRLVWTGPYIYDLIRSGVSRSSDVLLKHQPVPFHAATKRSLDALRVDE